ncbi:MAG: DUF4139 domain-containing protein [Melioribacteraceae bacterium]|nr:DUF4139 domain-containing protein [Melioribacteraceae bacterium]
MKIRLLFLTALLFSIQTIASNEINLKTELSGVKVFLRGAELQHTAKLKIEKGMTDLVFDGLASNIDRNSINISAKGDAVIISVVQRFDYMKPIEKNPAVIKLEDSLGIMNQKLFTRQNENDVLKSETDLILANKQLGSDSKSVSVIELQKMADFFRKRLGEIKAQQLILMNETKKIEKDIERIKKQLSELNARLSRPTNELVVTVSAKSNTSLELTLSYFISDAGWQPVYDVRVNNLNSPAMLNYKANVWQNSGFDWNDINVVLSTRNPIQNNNKPELYPWFIDFQTYSLNKDRMGAAQKSLAVAPMQVVSDMKESESMADYFSVEQKQLSVEFNPSIKYSVPSDGKPHTIAIQDFSIPAEYDYYAAPKLDNNAFLIAYLTKWNDYNLLPGQTNIYFENSYVGQSFIDPFTSKDTLMISLGRDQNITVKREVLRDFTEDKFLSSDVERFFGYDIVIRNNKNVPIKILIEEQIPISKNEDIRVKVIDVSGGNYTASNGKISWKLNLDGSKSITKKLVYSVRYPKDRTIQGL